MTGKVETSVSGVDSIKLAVAVVLLASGIVGFYWFSQESLLFRVLGLLAIAAMAVGVVATTGQGRSLLGFIGESRVEVRKVVWPTRVETMQTTLVVIVMVMLVGVFLWLLDMILGWAMRLLIGFGG